MGMIIFVAKVILCTELKIEGIGWKYKVVLMQEIKLTMRLWSAEIMNLFINIEMNKKRRPRKHRGRHIDMYVSC